MENQHTIKITGKACMWTFDYQWLLNSIKKKMSKVLGYVKIEQGNTEVSNEYTTYELHYQQFLDKRPNKLDSWDSTPCYFFYLSIAPKQT